MRRTYAFEAEGVSEEVKSQLEKVEDVVEDKCATPEACDKMIDKIDAEKDKFNGALKDMAAAAKDCKDGNCTKSEMAAAITPKMAELKEVAKSIGVASEGEALTEGELKDAKAYLDGAKEIVEAKKDELENGGSEEKADEPKGDDKDEDEAECEDGECDDDDDDEPSEDSFIGALTTMAGFESWTMSNMDEATEAMTSVESACYIAMEGYNWDKRKEYNAKVKEIRSRVKQAKAANKRGDTEEAKKLMNEAVSDLEKFKADFVKEAKENQSVGTAVMGYFASCWRALGMSLLTGLPTFGVGSMLYSVKKTIEFWVDVGQAIGKASKGELSPSDFNLYTKSMEHNMDLLIAHYKSVAKKMGAPAKGEPAAAAAESMLADDSIAMEMFGKNKARTAEMDDNAVIKAYVEANAGSMKTGEDVDTAMKTALDKYNEQMHGEGPSLTKKTIAGVPILVTSNDGKVIEIQYSTGGKRFKAVPMARMRSAVGKGLRKADKAGSDAPADESFTNFIEACESLMDTKSDAPYLFG